MTCLGAVGATSERRRRRHPVPPAHAHSPLCLCCRPAAAAATSTWTTPSGWEARRWTLSCAPSLECSLRGRSPLAATPPSLLPRRPSSWASCLPARPPSWPRWVLAAGAAVRQWCWQAACCCCCIAAAMERHPTPRHAAPPGCCAALLPCLQRLLKFVIAKVVFFACVGTSAYGSPMQASQLAGAGVLQCNSCCLPHDSSLWRLCPGLNRPPRAAPRHFLCSGWPGLR